MTDPATCPRHHPDTGERCGNPLDPAAFYGPCPTCTADIATRDADAHYRRCAAVAQAFADGYLLNDTGDEFVLAKDVAPIEEVIAGDRAGAPSRR